jgi:hypothetical protein
MAKTDHLKAHQFKPGNPGGPGRSKNWLKPSEIKDYIAKYARMTVGDLARVQAAKESSVIEVILAGVLLKIAEEPDPSKLEYVLNRTVGKIQEEHFDDTEGQPIVRIIRADGSVLEVHPPDAKAPTDKSIDPEE